MKKIAYFFLLLLVNDGFTQDSSRFLIKADQLVSEVLTPERIYQYPKFLQGRIFFRNQTFTEALLNYNYLSSEIEFIAPGADTMAIAMRQVLDIRKIIVNKDTFYYDKGYLQQVLQTPPGKLAKRQMLIVAKQEQLGAFDQPTSTTKVETELLFRDYYGSTVTPGMKAREDITLVYRNEFYLGDNYYSFLPANKKNLLKIFPSRKEMIIKYLEENKVNFRNGDDLKKLLLFLQ
ncbi:MAG: hypothetical protein ABI675_07580 [Chitinophagaceae bacterium]